MPSLANRYSFFLIRKELFVEELKLPIAGYKVSDKKDNLIYTFFKIHPIFNQKPQYQRLGDEGKTKEWIEEFKSKFTLAAQTLYKVFLETIEANPKLRQIKFISDEIYKKDTEIREAGILMKQYSNLMLSNRVMIQVEYDNREDAEYFTLKINWE